MECPSCNTNNHGNSKACSNCGVALAKPTYVSRTTHKPLRWRALVFLILGTLSMNAIGELGIGSMFIYFDFLPTNYWFSGIEARGIALFIGHLIAYGFIAIVTGIYPFIILNRWQSRQGWVFNYIWHQSLLSAILVGSLATNIIVNTLYALNLLLVKSATGQEFLILLVVAIVLSIYPVRIFFTFTSGIHKQSVIYAFITFLVTFFVLPNILIEATEIMLIVDSVSLSGAVMTGFFVYQLISRRMAPK